MDGYDPQLRCISLLRCSTAPYFWGLQDALDRTSGRMGTWSESAIMVINRQPYTLDQLYPGRAKPNSETIEHHYPFGG